MKKFIPNFAIVLAILVLNPNNSGAQIQINDSLTAEALVDDFFNSGVLVSISNVTFNGASADSISPRLALFTNGNSDSLNMDSGLIMYTGSTERIAGVPPDWIPIANYQDSDIQTMTGMPVNDCAVIEFDVLVEADALAFNYFFASAEYASFTCSTFNDGFGLFISGPGLEGPFTNNAVNIATIPNSTTPVAINTVNSGVSSYPGNEANCESANPNWIEDSQYFIQNSGNEVNDLLFTGYTENFEAYMEVVNGETYHIKFAICDASDGALDSGVFLETGSFEGRLLSGLRDMEHKALYIYPNPTTHFLNLENVCTECSGNIQFQIIDIQGRIVAEYQKPNTDQIRISTSGIEKGIYILNAMYNNQLLAYKKFVVE